MTARELEELVALIQARRGALDGIAMGNLSFGQRVRFTGKRGRVVEGTVTEFKRNGKLTLTSCSDGFIWRMPAHMVTPVVTP